MVSALAATAPNKERLRQSFQREVDATLAVMLGNDVGDDLVQAVQERLDRFSELIS